MISTGSLTAFPHRPPACDVALCRLQEKVHRWRQADRLDGVGHGCWDCQLHQSHVVIHAAAVKGWVDDDPLDGDDQGTYPGPQHRPQAHSPVSGTGVTVQQQWKQRRRWVCGNFPKNISRTYLLKQCAAVISHLLWTSVAPQRWSFWYWRLPTQGHSPLRAVTPPTILWVPRAGRIPQSAAEAANKKTVFLQLISCCLFWTQAYCSFARQHCWGSLGHHHTLGWSSWCRRWHYTGSFQSSLLLEDRKLWRWNLMNCTTSTKLGSFQRSVTRRWKSNHHTVGWRSW